MKTLIVILLSLTLASCMKKIDDADAKDRMFTVRHDGLCFVFMSKYKTGLAMVEVDCAKLNSSQRSRKSSIMRPLERTR